jgi:hypothetical protein
MSVSVSLANFKAKNYIYIYIYMSICVLILGTTWDHHQLVKSLQQILSMHSYIS